MLYLQLFWSFFQIGLLSFGGGYAAMPLIQHQVVELHQWLNMAEFTDLITISQMTPGPIAINSATFVGQRIAGLPGAIVATLGNVVPSCIIVIALAILYNKYKKLPLVQDILSGLRPAIIALIGGACLTMLFSALWGDGGNIGAFADIDWIAVALFLGSIIILRWKKPDPIVTMVGCGIVGGVVYYVLG